jgi:hypothetical protein
MPAKGNAMDLKDAGEAIFALYERTKAAGLDGGMEDEFLKWTMVVSNMGDSTAAGAVGRAIEAGMFTPEDVGTITAIEGILAFHARHGGNVDEDTGAYVAYPHAGQAIRYLRGAINYVCINFTDYFKERDTSGMVSDIEHLKPRECFAFAVAMMPFIFAESLCNEFRALGKEEVLYKKNATDPSLETITFDFPTLLVRSTTRKWMEVKWIPADEETAQKGKKRKSKKSRSG